MADLERNFKNYTEFMEAFNNDVDNSFEIVVDCDDFQVILDKKSKRFYYVECGENDADTFCEVVVVARLIYDVNHDLKIDHNEAGIALCKLFDCDICGEAIYDDHIKYLWFKIKK